MPSISYCFLHPVCGIIYLNLLVNASTMLLKTINSPAGLARPSRATPVASRQPVSLPRNCQQQQQYQQSFRLQRLVVRANEVWNVLERSVYPCTVCPQLALHSAAFPPQHLQANVEQEQQQQQETEGKPAREDGNPAGVNGAEQAQASRCA